MLRFKKIGVIEKRGYVLAIETDGFKNFTVDKVYKIEWLNEQNELVILDNNNFVTTLKEENFRKVVSNMEKIKELIKLVNFEEFCERDFIIDFGRTSSFTYKYWMIEVTGYEIEEVEKQFIEKLEALIEERIDTEQNKVYYGGF